MRKSILFRLSLKGGLYGQVAQLHRYDRVKADRLIIECFEQCHNKAAQEFWGQALVADIIWYRLEMIRQPLKKLLLTEAPSKRKQVNY